MGQMIPDHPPAPATPMGLKTNGVSKKLQHDVTFTEKVIAATGPNANRRLVQVMPSLVRHLHAFAREVNLTVAEWMAAVEFVCKSPRASLDIVSFRLT